MLQVHKHSAFVGGMFNSQLESACLPPFKRTLKSSSRMYVFNLLHVHEHSAFVGGMFNSQLVNRRISDYHI
jgi:hypothetical protein